MCMGIQKHWILQHSQGLSKNLIKVLLKSLTHIHFRKLRFTILSNITTSTTRPHGWNWQNSFDSEMDINLLKSDYMFWEGSDSTRAALTEDTLKWYFSYLIAWLIAFVWILCCTYDYLYIGKWKSIQFFSWNENCSETKLIYLREWSLFSQQGAWWIFFFLDPPWEGSPPQARLKFIAADPLSFFTISVWFLVFPPLKGTTFLWPSPKIYHPLLLRNDHYLTLPCNFRAGL